MLDIYADAFSMIISVLWCAAHVATSPYASDATLLQCLTCRPVAIPGVD